jgi:hypothetical protein
MKHKNIVIAPCGNKSFLFREAWLKDEADRNFDVCLLFYHENIDRIELYEGIDHLFHLKDFKYIMLYKLFTQLKPEWLNEYEYFYFLDDDIEITTKDINRMFDASRLFGSSISCASLSADSFYSWPIFRQHPNCYLRYVRQIEVMAPLVDRAALKTILPTFIETRSSWGLDAVWPKLLGYPKDRLIVFDNVVMKHTLPVGGGELYLKIGVDPKEEWLYLTKKYAAKVYNYEYGRLRPLTNNHNKVYRLQNSIRHKISTIQREIRDYDLFSRIKNKWNILLGKQKLTS